MRKSAFITLVMLFGLSGFAAAADQDLGAALTSRYHDQILALRHSFKARSQDYDSQGNPVINGSEGSWTVYGRMDVKKVSVAADKLQLEGDQVVFESNKRGDPLKPVRQHEHVKISIRLDHALASQDEALAVLGRVFALTPQDVVSSAPSLWRPYLAKQLNTSPAAKSEAAQDTGAQDKPADDGKTGFEIVTDEGGRQRVFKLGKEMVAPKPQFTPEPEYSAIARKQRVQGHVTLDVMIDNTGRVGRITLLHAMGLGLDEAAAEAVSTWKFTPATLDGRPVAVALNIEVDFHLY